MKMPSSFRILLRRTNVKRQLNFIYFIALILPLILIGSVLIFNTKNLLSKHYQNQVDADNIRVKSIMFDVTTSVYNISDEIFSDKNLQTLFATRYATKQAASQACSTYYYTLRKYFTKNTFISSIELYTTNQTIDHYASIKPVTDAIQDSNWYPQVSSQADVLWKSLEIVDAWKHTSQELCLMRRIPIISTGEYVVLIIHVSNNYLKNRIQYNTLFTTITVNQDPIFFSTERDLPGTAFNLPIDYTKKQYLFSGPITYNGTETIANISTLLPYYSDDKIYISTLNFDALPDISNIILTFIVIILIASILPFLMISFFTNRFSARIITLRGEMHKASKGDYDIIEYLKGDDELSEVFSDLKVMIHSIKQMDSQMYEAKLSEQLLKNQQQKMEFKMLASQINPHFLYNTLETIRMKALTQGNREVANAIKLLGKSMHYVLENNGISSTTLKKELDYISTYLAIQRLRFSDRVNYTLQVPEEMDLEEYQILPLLLQPVVENAILHGLEGTEENGQIVIDVKTQSDELLMIQILDNGLGMTQEELVSLNNNIQMPNRKSSMSIGLYNINQRIKLFYGDKYGMEIKSSPKEGTCVTLTIPLNKTMEE